MKKLKILLESFIFTFSILLVFLSFSKLTFATTYYWVGGTTDSNTSSIYNWSTTSGACADSANLNVPESSDALNFNSNCVNDVTFDGNLSVASITTGLGYSGTMDVNNVDVVSSGALLMSGGVLNITNGATLTTGSTARLGYSNNSEIEILIDGSGSSWTNGGSVTVPNGIGSTASITIQNGGSMTSAGVYNGFGASGEGTILVDGIGSTLTNTGWSFYGYGGAGIINIQNGAILTTNGVTMARNVGSVCDFTVTGEGTTWTDTSGLNLGSSGETNILIEDGAEVNSVSATLSLNSVTDTLTIDGEGTIWTNSGNFYVGYNASSDGVLNLTNGGVLNVGDGTGTVTVAYATDSVGTINVGSGYNLDLLQSGTITAGDGTASFPPLVPENLSGDATSYRSIDWDWDDLDGATGYKIYNSSDELLTTISSATSKWTQEGLSENTQYTIYVRGTNSNGGGYASSVSVTTPRAPGTTGTSVSTRIKNLKDMGKEAEAQKLLNQYPELTPTPEPQTNPITIQAKNITRTLRYSNRGEDVKTLQLYLNQKLNTNLMVDGIFGAKTKQVLISFQLINGLIPDGVVGPLTRREMK